MTSIMGATSFSGEIIVVVFRSAGGGGGGTVGREGMAREKGGGRGEHTPRSPSILSSREKPPLLVRAFLPFHLKLTER